MREARGLLISMNRKGNGDMDKNEYQVESNHEILGPTSLPINRALFRTKNRDLAVAVAAKSRTAPLGQEIRVVHVHTGEVVFRKTVTQQNLWGDN